MSGPSVIVVGGGLAGLQAAIACRDAGAKVTLLESRPRLGGATWSRQHRGLVVDNGQHVFLRCCSAYQAFLGRLGVADRVSIQPSLRVPVVVPGRKLQWIRRSRLPAPVHLASSLLRFGPLPLRDRLRAARTAAAFRTLEPDDPRLDPISLGDWLAARGESDAAIDGLWDLLVRPTLNLSAREASLALAARVMRTGFLDRADAADLGLSRVPLAALHADPAAKLLATMGAEVVLRARVVGIEPGPRPTVRFADRRVEADAVILATPHAAAGRLAPPEAGLDREALGQLGQAPIVNLHVVFDRPVMRHAFAAVLDSPLQWVFDRTGPAGLPDGQYLAVSLSAADAWLARSQEELRLVFLPALAAAFPAVREARVLDFFTTVERRATFRQAPGTGALRPGPVTAAAGIFLAGAWTATGWPDTMESAVRSGVAAARAALRASGQTQGLPALVAA